MLLYTNGVNFSLSVRQKLQYCTSYAILARQCKHDSSSASCIIGMPQPHLATSSVYYILTLQHPQHVISSVCHILISPYLQYAISLSCHPSACQILIFPYPEHGIFPSCHMFDMINPYLAASSEGHILSYKILSMSHPQLVIS